MTQPQPKNSDLPVRVASALVMVAVAGTALWLGGWVWTAFVALVALGVLWEWTSLALAISRTMKARIAWFLGGAAYISLAALLLHMLRMSTEGAFMVGALLVAVIGVDVGAYFAGRTFGGPRIAPAISPSKTWAGLIGGAVGAGLLTMAFYWSWWSVLCPFYYELTDPPLPPGFGLMDARCHHPVPTLSSLPAYIAVGAIVAVVAQAGDFFESWMKRRAGVKDSGFLIPGHGGLFDRLDGLLAVLFVLGVVAIGIIAVTLMSGGELLPTPA